MEDEEGYTILNLRPKTTTSDPSHPPDTPGPPLCPRWYWPALGISWAGNVVLLVAVVMMGAWGNFKTSENDGAHERTICGSNCSTELETFPFHFRQFLCDPPTPSSRVSACKLCPTNWLLHRDKCYWVSTEKQSWNRSHEDCSKRRAWMLIIQDQDEMAFIQTTTKGANRLWLGLTITSDRRRLWEDGSLLNETLFKVVDPVEGNSCGAIRADQIHFDTCSVVSKWICEKDALLV